MPKFAINVEEAISPSGVKDLTLFLSTLQLGYYDSHNDRGGKKLTAFLKRFETSVLRGRFYDRLSGPQALGVFSYVIEGDAAALFDLTCGREPPKHFSAYVKANAEGVLEEVKSTTTDAAKVWTYQGFKKALWDSVMKDMPTNGVFLFPQEQHQVDISITEYMDAWETRLTPLMWDFSARMVDAPFALKAFFDNLVLDLRRRIAVLNPKYFTTSWGEMRTLVFQAVEELASEGTQVDLSQKPEGEAMFKRFNAGRTQNRDGGRARANGANSVKGNVCPKCKGTGKFRQNFKCFPCNGTGVFDPTKKRNGSSDQRRHDSKPDGAPKTSDKSCQLCGASGHSAKGCDAYSYQRKEEQREDWSDTRYYRITATSTTNDTGAVEPVRDELVNAFREGVKGAAVARKAATTGRQLFFTDIQLNGREYSALVDTGCTDTIITKQVCSELFGGRAFHEIDAIEPAAVKTEVGGGTLVPIQHQVRLKLKLLDCELEVVALVIDHDTIPVVLGLSVLQKCRCIVNVGLGLLQTAKSVGRLEAVTYGDVPPEVHRLRHATVVEEGSSAGQN